MASLAPNVDLLEPRGGAVTQENPGTNELLTSILHVLHKLDSRLDEQSKCIQALSKILSTSSPGLKEPRILSASTNKPEGAGKQEEPINEKAAQYVLQSHESNKDERPSKKRTVLIPPIIADNKPQREELNEAFQSSTFGPRYRKGDELTNSVKQAKTLFKEQRGREGILVEDTNLIEILVEDTAGNVTKLDYVNDGDAYLGQKILRESVEENDLDNGSSVPSGPNLVTLQARKVRYLQFPPPTTWQPGMRTLLRERTAEQNFTSLELERVGRVHLGALWAAPPDGRVEFSFQSHHLKWLGRQQGTEHISKIGDSLSSLDDMGKNIRWDPCLLIEDYGLAPDSTAIPFLRTVRTIPKTQAEVNLIRHSTTTMSLSKNREYMAPWKRIVQFKGFSNLQGLFETSRNEDTPALAGPAFSLLFVSLDRKYHDNSLRLLVEDSMRKHVTCARDPRIGVQIPKFLSITYTSFHVTFFELIKQSPMNTNSSWKSGNLYGDSTNDGRERATDGGMCIRESACTILVIIDDQSQYWTALYMRPETFPRYKRAEYTKDHDEGIAADLLIQAIECVTTRWKMITSHLKTFIVDHHLLLNPEGHDMLLFDDDSFSRSRKYFWVINFLAECNSRIDENIQELDNAVSDWSGKLERGKWDDYMNRISDKRFELTEVQDQLKAKRAETIALRDGLFSASAVMESRASTRLGENVKLLTFVSIFFLPLSFCTSLWSINDTILSLNAFIGVIIAVTLGTYLVVFNLNTLVGICSRIYRKQKKKLIEHMSADEKWKREGKRFKSFQPRQETSKPSEWKVAVFLLTRLVWRKGEGERIESGGELKREETEDRLGMEDEIDDMGIVGQRTAEEKTETVVAEPGSAESNSTRFTFHSILWGFLRRKSKNRKTVTEV